MQISHIEHLGIAVKSLADAIPYYENILGVKCYATEEVADQKVKTAFFMVGQTKIELLEPTCPESTIASFIEKRGEGIHHVAFCVDNAANALKEVEEKGVSRKGIIAQITEKRHCKIFPLDLKKSSGKDLT